ncbi:MAG: hypothetical protein MUO53_03060 [Maribacter sp.]|nr:hypothetical protein [Maribacter sp.]
MRSGLVGILYFCALWATQAQSTIGVDKLKHFGVGFAIGAVGGYTANKIFKGNRYWTWAGAVGSSLAAGLVKENIDKNEYDGWDNNDILFTTLGGAVSGLALELLLKKNRRSRKPIADRYRWENWGIPPAKKIIFMQYALDGSHDLGANLQAQKILFEGY